MDQIDEYLSSKVKAVKVSGYGRLLQIIETNNEFDKLFCYNLVTKEVNYSRKSPWSHAVIGDTITDDEMILLKGYFTRKFNISPSTKTILEAVIDQAKKLQFNPIVDWLNGLKWDGKNRLENFFSYICGTEDNIYTRDIGKKLFMSLVARAIKPGIKFDNLIVFEGAQGILKSTLIKEIVSKKYYASVGFHQTDKDIVDIMRGKWALEIEEMADFKKTDVERVKSLLSRDTDRIRLSYGRLAEDFPRACIFLGTLNPKGNNKYLQDEVANRRFWPIACNNKIKLDVFLKYREQYFAEALELFNKGEQLYITDDKVLDVAIKEQFKRQDTDPWLEIIADYLEKIPNNTVTTMDVLVHGLNVPKLQANKYMAMRIAVAMKDLGWAYVRNLEGKAFYKRPKNQEMILRNVDNEIQWID